MARKAKAEHTPKRKRQQRAAIERDQDDAPKPIRSLDPSSPLAQRMRADQERLRQFKKKHGLAEAQERLRLFGQELGLNLIAEKLRKFETPPPQRTRKPGAGRKPKFKPEHQAWLQARYKCDLRKNPRLAAKLADVAVPHVQKLAKDKYGIDAGRNTLLGQIIRPVLRAIKNDQK
jgi:hypothetical protein